jgi:two-component system, chemotaxis family, protein-glutamate methylesterase/glutaminase
VTAIEVPTSPVTPLPISVLLVAGTQVRLRQLEQLVISGPGFVVTGHARDAQRAEDLVKELRPATVLVDLELFGGGLETIERIMAAAPTPIVVCGAAAEHPEAAIAAGAVDVVGALDVPAGSPQYADFLCRHLRVASRVKVITHPRARLRARRTAEAAPAPYGTRPPVVAFGASTGGPPALATILGDVPADFPAAVLVIQHMAEGFVEGLARWLDGVCPLRVVVAADGERLTAGTVYLAPAGLNLSLRSGHRVELLEPPATQFHVPGIDRTFTTVAQVCGARSVGVLLTGMGRDGAVGLRAMRDAGAFTIGQDEASSVVWGMPAAAQQADAVDVELSLPAIAAAVVEAVSRIAPAADRVAGAR